MATISAPSQFVAELGEAPDLREAVEDEGLDTIIEERGYEFTAGEVEDAIREMVIDEELPDMEPNEVESVKALYTVTHVCTCKCTVSC